MSVDPERRNVVLIISDQHQAAVTGCYGHPMIRTPHIDRLADRGVRFTNAYCQSPLCVPSRSSLLTGVHCHTCRAYSERQKFPIRVMPTVGDAFRDAGYVTGSFGKVHVPGETRDGWDLGFTERAMRLCTYGGQDYIDAVGAENAKKYHPRQDVFNPDNVPVDLDESLLFDALVVERSIDFMARHREEPFFLWVGLDKPHPSWLAPKAFHVLYDPAEIAIPDTARAEKPDVPDITWRKLRQACEYTDDQIRNSMAAYYANVSYMDHNVGRVLDAVDRLGLAENTVVAYTTDHGELLFDHGMTQKHCFFESSVAVPLIVAGPGLPSGQARDHIVSLLDLFPTFLDLTGLTLREGVEGESLVDVIDGTAPTDGRCAFSEFYSFGYAERMIRTGRWKYIHSEGYTPQLYDLLDDPLELNNLATDPAHADLCRDLDTRVTAGWELPDPAAIARPDLQ